MLQSKHQSEKQQNQTNAKECKNRKRKNRRKLSKGSGPTIKCEPKELAGTAGGDSCVMAEKKPLHTSMEQLPVVHKTTTPIASRKAAGSNWEAVAKSNQPAKQNTSGQDKKDAEGEENRSEPIALSKSARHRQKRRAAEQKYVSIDCEMVGVGLNGQDDMLARVSIVNKRGEVLLDKFVKPQEAVTDFRTNVSGVRPHDIENGEDFKTVQEEVVQMLHGKANKNDIEIK